MPNRLLASPIARSIAVGVASRVFSLALLGLCYAALPTTLGPEGGFWSRPFAIWDGAWYVGIATTGYHAQPVGMGALGPLYDIAFFPLWPAVIWLTSLGGLLPGNLMAGIASNVLFVAACPVIHRALAPRLGSEVAMWGVALLAFSPAAYVFSLGYSESLFLVLAALAFATLQARWLVLGQLSRLTGVSVGLGLAVDAFLAGDRRRALFWVAVPVLVLGLWFVASALIMGRPDGYLLGSPSWYAGNGVVSGPASLMSPQGVLAGTFMLIMALGSVAIIRRAPGLAAYALGLIAAAVLLGVWHTMPRLALCGFPAFAGLALVAPRSRVVVVVGFGLLQAAFVYAIVAGPVHP
jgi:hypothetical protein